MLICRAPENIRLGEERTEVGRGGLGGEQGCIHSSEGTGGLDGGTGKETLKKTRTQGDLENPLPVWKFEA